LLSVGIGRSVLLGMQLLPAVLLFFLVAEHFHGPQENGKHVSTAKLLAQR
jgi:hypothetical protein